MSDFRVFTKTSSDGLWYEHASVIGTYDDVVSYIKKIAKPGKKYMICRCDAIFDVAVEVTLKKCL